MREIARVVLLPERDYRRVHRIAGWMRVTVGVTCLLLALLLGAAVELVADGPEGLCGNCPPGSEVDR